MALIIRKKGKRYPVVNTPVSKHYLVELLEKYPEGIYINNGKKLEFVTSQTNVNRFDIKIDFINSMKVLGLIIGLYYSFVLKNRVKKKVNETLYNSEDRLKELKEELEKKRANKKPSFSMDEEE